jgi:peptidyl-prolyl cis-trans isomerase D
LIVVTERKKGEQPSLAEVREQIQENIQADEARIVLLRTVESLKDLAFNAEDLAYPAKELSLVVKQSDRVTRTQNEGLFSNSALVEAAFSEEVVSSSSNSEVIEVDADKFVVLHVRKHHAPEIKPLASVREEVMAAVADEMARAVVAAKADNALEQLRGGLAAEQYAKESGYALQVELGVDRRNATVPPDVLRRIFELPRPAAADKIETDIILAPNGDALVIQLLRVNAGDYKALQEGEKEALQQILSRESGNLINNQFQRNLRDRADITVL